LPDEDEQGSLNHEDAIYPTTKLSMINIAIVAITLRVMSPFGKAC